HKLVQIPELLHQTQLINWLNIRCKATCEPRVRLPISRELLDYIHPLRRSSFDLERQPLEVALPHPEAIRRIRRESDRVGCFTAVRMSAWAKLTRFARRFVHFKQMDFEFASWQMLYLLIQPQKVYRNFIYRKRTKDQFARDDPAFLSITIFVSFLFFGLLCRCPRFDDMGIRQVLSMGCLRRLHRCWSGCRNSSLVVLKSISPKSAGPRCGMGILLRCASQRFLPYANPSACSSSHNLSNSADFAPNAVLPLSDDVFVHLMGSYDNCWMEYFTKRHGFLSLQSSIRRLI
ncbi:UNC-50 family protein, partial [Ostertagia ostertagi]